MNTTLRWRRYHIVARVTAFLVMVASIAGMVGCGEVAPPTGYSLIMAVAPNGSGTATDLTGGSPYAGGTVVSIKAVAAAGYDFVNWTAPAGGFASANAAETTFTMPAKDVTVTANFEAEQVVVFDFVAEASSNRTFWESGTGLTGEEGSDWILTFPGTTSDHQGFACFRTSVVLEDDLTYDTVLETHPQWVNDGFIRGGYLGLYDMGYKIEAGDRFYAKVGLLKGATAGNVTFKVWSIVEGAHLATIAETTDIHDGTLQTIDVDLSPYVSGLRCTFILGVLANGPSGQDWATWAEAKIIR